MSTKIKIKLSLVSGSFSYKTSMKQGLYAALQELEEAVRKNFTTQQHIWPRLSPMTQRQRLLQGYSPQGPKLIRTGGLMNERAVNYRKVTSNEAIVGTTDDRAIKLNNGEGKVPARPFYKLSETAEERIVEAYWKRFNQSWKIG